MVKTYREALARLQDKYDPYAPYTGRVYHGQDSLPNPRGSKSYSGATLVGWSYMTVEGRVMEYIESWRYDKTSEKMAQNEPEEDIRETASQEEPLIVDGRNAMSMGKADQKKKVQYDPPTSLDPGATEFNMVEGSSSTEEILSKSPEPKNTASPESLLKRSDAPTEGSPSREPATSFTESGKSTLAHPIVWDPATPQDLLPYKEFTEKTPVCAAIGHYHSRPKAPKPTHPMMTSEYFTLIIRLHGPFDRNGRQPGLIIPQTKHFTLRVMEKGYVPGERKVEIWRNGETFQLFGLVAVMADECGWFLGDEKLRRVGDGYVGREEGRKLAAAVGLGQP